jgi:hypothetical protein
VLWRKILSLWQSFYLRNERTLIWIQKKLHISSLLLHL